MITSLFLYLVDKDFRFLDFELIIVKVLRTLQMHYQNKIAKSGYGLYMYCRYDKIR